MVTKIAVTSTKGGVGKTTITAGIAQNLAQRGYKVGALDLDTSSPTLHLAFGLDVPPKWGTDSRKSQVLPFVLDSGIELVTMASHWNPESKGTRVEAKGADKAKLTRQVLMGDVVGWSMDREYFCIDSPPSMSEEIFVIAEDKAISGYVIVTQPQQMSIVDIERLVDFCRDKHLPIYGIVSNFDGCLTAQGEKFYPYLGSHVDVPQWCTERQIPFLASIPQVGTIQQLQFAINDIVDHILTAAPITLPTREKIRMFKRETLKILLEGGSSEDNYE